MVRFLRLEIFIHMMRHNQKNLGFKFQLNQSNRLDMRRDKVFCKCLIPYCVSIMMATITRNIFINIIQTVHFLAVTFTRGGEKNMTILLIPKSQKVWEKSGPIGLGFFKSTATMFVTFTVWYIISHRTLKSKCFLSKNKNKTKNNPVVTDSTYLYLVIKALRHDWNNHASIIMLIVLW